MDPDEWTTVDLPDQTGRTVVVTGANSGLGRVTAGDLATAGARVVLAVRDLRRGSEEARGMAGETDVRQLDLSDLSSVRRFADRWDGPIDVLVNNAGVMAVPLQRTADGFEMQIGTNHLGHFALTNLLLPHLRDRVVTVASVGHRMGRISLDDLNWESRRYRRWAAYGQSKLANLLFTSELQRRLGESGSAMRAVAAHPGYAATKLTRHSRTKVQSAAMSVADRFLAQSDQMGALPILYAAAADVPPDGYVGPNGRHETRGHPTLVGRNSAARDMTMAGRLWTLSEQLTGVTYGLERGSG